MAVEEQACEGNVAAPNYGFEHLIGKVLVGVERQGNRLRLSFGDNPDSESGGMISVSTELSFSKYSITSQLWINAKGKWVKGINPEPSP